MESVEVELKALVQKRGQLKASLTRFDTFLKKPDTQKRIVELKTRLNTIETIFSNYDDVQSRIEALSESESLSDERENFECHYFETISLAKEILLDIESHSNQAGSSVTFNDISSNNSQIKNIKLPTLELPKFYGEYDKWLNFRDTFTSLVHNDKNLNDVTKFHYLTSCLKGTAELALNSLDVTAGNYSIAWDLLRDRFENKGAIKRTHLKALLEWPAITRESHIHLRKLLDGLSSHLKSLRSLNEPVEHWNSIIIYIFTGKLDPDTNREWEKYSNDMDNPQISDFTTFLTKRCHFLESLNDSLSNKSNIKNHYKRPNENKSVSHVAAINNPSCYYCKSPEHFIYKCPTFMKLPAKSRLEHVRKLNMCTNCLRSSHTVESCVSGGCIECGRKHNTILHFRERESSNIDQVNHSKPLEKSVSDVSVTNERNNISETERSSVTTHASNKEKAEILLSTALIDIKDKFGKFHTCRLLLDSGSQSNFIRKDLCNTLQLNKQSVNIPVAGISQSSLSISEKTNATIQSKYNAFKIELPFLILDKITENLPISKVKFENLQIPKNIILADPTFHLPGQIDLLIGASMFYELLSIGQVRLGDHLPILQKTKLGWVISGGVPYHVTDRTNKQQVSVCNFASSLENQIERFWLLETVNNTHHLSKEEAECEEHFIKTTKRDESGHFVVSSPLRENISELGDSYRSALKRFKLLENKLSKNDDLKNHYDHFMQEYRMLGHMSLVNDPNTDNITYFLPHHGIFKQSSTTTKIRVVFDGSTKTDSGISLNDKLKVGPTVQDDLFSILTRFRKHTFVIVADIEKMYRQIFIQDDQRDLQRILWRSDPDQSLQQYRLNTVTYGTASAAFLATRCLRQVGIETQSLNSTASNTILKDFYVDDLLTGAESIDDAKHLMQDLIKILDSYGFPLRKWSSNDRTILENITNNGSNPTHFISDDKVTKTLGLLWNSETDVFQYTVDIKFKNERITKRTILSTISQIFDPLGLVGPVVVTAKIILQQLWHLKLDWDEAIPIDLYTTWFKFYNEIHSLNNLKIPRHVICSDSISIQLHTFCAASEQAYGTCVYIRCTDASNNYFARLLCAKSRVAPLKRISLPRLELCGALLAAQLTHKVINSINIKFDRIIFWCDSTITLAWIAGEPSQWNTFIANRVSDIQELTDQYQWRHIKSEENPSDIISRGATPQHLASSKLWWHGPHWLTLSEESWPYPNASSSVNIPERKTPKVSLTTNNTKINNIFDKFSSLTTLQRVVAWCFRFRHNTTCLAKNKITGPLSINELNSATSKLISTVQSNEFAAEIKSLSHSNSVHPKSKLICLNPFLDDKGLIRVGGRLKLSELPYRSKYPIVLPNRHPFTRLLILHEHQRHLHSGIQATLYAIRSKYWILNGRSIVRGILRRCIICFKAKPIDTFHQMGNLPLARLKPSRPFSTTGIDFAGQFFIKDGKYRNRKIVKCYLCIFICFVTKATHLELTGDLSTDSFLNALKRMVSRRGLCKAIYTDNGTNFVGANNELKLLLSDLHKNSKFREFIIQNAISWNFIPPRLPHFGGIWEAAVKSAKYHLQRILNKSFLTFEEFYTVLTQVEAVLNSRPLTPLSNDPNDFLCLTPGHFLIGEPLTALPQDDVTDTPSNRLSRYKHLQQLLQHFWARWSNEYLNSLHQRTKWKLQVGGVQVGSMVLLTEEHAPPLQWKMGRVCATFPGQDGVTRVVDVKTASGIVRRGVAKICVLPIDP